MEMMELVRRAQNGDTDAQGALYEQTYKRVYYLALRLTKNPEDAQDATQEAYISAFKALPNLQDLNAFQGWLFQIVANKCKNSLRKGAHETEMPETGDGRDFCEELPDENENILPEAVLESAEKRRLILQIIDDLPAVQRECVMLFYYSGMSVKQIAQTLECSEGTIKSRLNYARQKIRDGVLLLEEQDGIRLHVLIPIGLLFAKDVELTAASLTAAALGGAGTAGVAGAASTASATTAGTVKAGLLATMKAKVIAGVTAAAIAVGGVAVVSQMPKAIAFSDPAMEQNIRILVDKPEGKLYADDVDKLRSIYVFEDGMASTQGGSISDEPQSGTVPVKSLKDLALLPKLGMLYYYGADETLLQTLTVETSLHTLLCLGQQDSNIEISDFSFLNHQTELRMLNACVAPGTDLAPIEQRSSLRSLSLICPTSLSLQADTLQNLVSLTMSANPEGMAEGVTNELVLTKDLPNLRELRLHGGVVPTLDILNHTPTLQMLDIYSKNMGQLDLTPVGGLQSLRAMAIIGNNDEDSFNLAPLADCPALEVYYALNGQCMNPPPQAITDTESDMPNYNRVSREVQMETSKLLYGDMYLK